MKKGQKLSILLASTMIFNLFAFPTMAGASILDNNTVYELEGDTNPYITEDDTKEPVVQAPEVKAKTVLDIGRGNITISSGSVTGFTPSGAIAKVNPDGYEITGSTTTNFVTVNNAVPIAINGVTMNYAASIANVGINMVHGGEITLLGHNNLTRANNTSSSNTFIGHTSGKLIIRGNGALNISDSEDQGSTIGGNVNKAANMLIDGRVSIQITSPVANYGARIGSGYSASNQTNTIVIGERAEVEAYNNGSGAQGAVIGSAYGGSNLNNDITISGDAVVWAYGGSGTSYPAVIGTWHSGGGNANIKIEDSAFVKVFNRSTYTSTGAEPAGMGFSPASITSGMINRSNVRIAPTANVEAPTRESFYKAPNGTTPVYRIVTATSAPNTRVAVSYGSVTRFINTDANGNMYSYLPLGAISINIDGLQYKGTVNSSGTSGTTQQSDGKKTVLDIGRGTITINGNSLNGYTPAGRRASYDVDGYEITGTTTTNRITNQTAVPIAINNVDIRYSSNVGGNAINMPTGGEITVLGTNTINNTSNVALGNHMALIGQDAGRITIKGNGTLNMTDYAQSSPTIGGNITKPGDVIVEGDVKINGTKTHSSNYGAIIGGGQNPGTTTYIRIRGNAVVNATIEGMSYTPVIGTYTTQSVTIVATIEANAQLIANGGTGATVVPVIGGINGTAAPYAQVFIKDGAYVKLTPRGTTGGTVDAPGMGFSSHVSLTGNVGQKTTINIAPTANVEAPTRETFYRASNNSTPVYRATATHFVPNSEVTVKYGSSTATTRADSAGKIYLYLPTGTQTVVLDGATHQANVNSSGTAVFALIKDNIQTVLDISKATAAISNSSVTAQTPAGIAAPVDPDGYEIVGSTKANRISVSNSVPITLNGITIDGVNTPLYMATGGDVTLKGTNTVKRASYTGARALIEQDTGTLNFIGTGTLNITDEATIAATIGDDNGSRSVVVKIGSGINLNIDKDGSGAAIGTTNHGLTGTANITIADGATVDISNASTAKATNAVGMGLPASAPITNDMLARMTVKVSPRANVNAPARENYYKNLAGNAAVYKVAVQGLAANANLSVVYDGTTQTLQTSPNGGLYLYLPIGTQIVTIAGEKFECVVEDSENNKMFIKTILSAKDISVHASEGIKGQSLKGHETTNSPAGIKYTITDAGKTGVILTGTTLNWNKPGTVKMNVSQEVSGKYSSASKDFVVNITEAPGDIEVSVLVDTASAGFGTIAVINENNQEIVPFVQPGTEITLKAIADEGYEVEKWVKTTQVTKATKGTKAVTTETLIATPSLRIVANAAESYTAFFRAKPVVPGPKLSVLQVSSMVLQPDGTFKEKYKPLIRQDGTQDVSFDKNKLVYGVYLRSIDSNNINVYVRHADTKPLNVKIGNLATTQVNPFNKYSVDITLSGKAYEEIPVLVTKGGESTTYVLKVFKEQKVENDPHVYAELEINPIKENLELGIYAVNVDVNAFDMTMKIDESLAADKQAFTAFVNNNGVAFNDLNTSLAGNAANYFNLDPKFEMANMRSDGKFITFTVNVRPGWGAISIGATPRKILSVNVKRNPNYTGSVVTEIDTLRMEPVSKGTSTYGNNLHSKFYGDLNDTFQANRAEDEKTLSYLVFRGKPDTIKMYVSFDANLVDRVTYEIMDVSVPNNRQVVESGDVVDQIIQQVVIKSTYRVRVLADGYLLAESQDVVYDGTPSKYGIIMTPVRLLEGDLTDNGVINGEDRAKLITVLNTNVLVKGSGFVELAGNKIYADYNDDDRINSLDLGRLVQNIGKQYGLINRT